MGPSQTALLLLSYRGCTELMLYMTHFSPEEDWFFKYNLYVTRNDLLLL